MKKQNLGKELMVLVLLITMLLPHSNEMVLASSKDINYKIMGSKDQITLEQLLNKFKMNSINYHMMKNSYELESQNYEVEKEKLENLILLADDSTVAEASLQVDLGQFYKENQANLIGEAGKKLELDFMKTCYLLMINKETRDYYSVNSDYLSTLHTIEYKKYKKGFSSSDKVEDAQADIDVNMGMIQEVDYDYMDIRRNIEAGIGEEMKFSILLPLPTEERSFDQKSTIARYKANNCEYKLLQHQVNSYRTYLGTLDGNSSIYKQVNLMIKDYQLQMNRMDQSFKIQVNKAINNYYVALKKWNASKSKLSVAEKRCINANKQFERGKIPKNQLLKSQVMKEEKELEYYSYYYKVALWKYIIENSIYGAKV